MTQVLETALLNKLNYQILIATKAARIREIGHAQVMMEFGLRRAPDLGGNAGARAAIIGGADYFLERWRLGSAGDRPERHPRTQHGAALHGNRADRAGCLSCLRGRLSRRLPAAGGYNRYDGERHPERDHRV